MLVYGDVECVETVEAKQEFIEAVLAQVGRLPPGIGRHAALVTAFIATSELVQGIVDGEFQERGFDALSPAHERGTECLSLLACSILRSWRGRFAEAGPPVSFLETLSGFDPSTPIRTKRPEGYAFYALYPESYLEAAARSGLGPETRVIGIRSIGAGLGALVAAALGAPPPFTVRPVGHPFRREVKIDPITARTLTADKSATFAIVDEGPGLSGSSFGAVADWLEASGIPRGNIHFFPSHGGELGPQASDAHRDRWKAASRHIMGMDELLLRAQPPHALTAWVEDILGPLDGPLEDISGGAWRAKRYPDEASWPPANVQHERRKFLARAGGSAWLVKFVGLGETGMRKHRQAERLHAAGFTPEVAGYRHGFLVERWHENAHSLDQTSIARDHLVRKVGDYLGFRARHCSARDPQGASLTELCRMAHHNTRQALGAAAAAALNPALARAAELEGQVRRVETDNRMHQWEWLVSGTRLIKADAIDHAVTHDLVGSQDIGWDIAGAVFELGLTPDEASSLCRIVERESGYPVLPELLRFLRPCYLAFQMGAHRMAADAIGGQEAARLQLAAERYAAFLREDVSNRH